MSGSDTIITMGGRKGRKVSKLLSLHVENEAPVRSLRYRRPRVTPLSPPENSNWGQEEEEKTPPVYQSNDSGYLGDSTPPGSEPDWSVELFSNFDLFSIIPVGSSGHRSQAGGMTGSSKPNMKVWSREKVGVSRFRSCLDSEDPTMWTITVLSGS